MELAAEHKLSDPKTLEAQVRRMLADPRARALTDQFGAQWLQIRKLSDARPSTEFFPTFTQELRKAMYDETATYFDKLREEDRSVLELLNSDYTYLNGPLAQHYKISGVDGPAMRRVSLKPADHRGGLLGMGSILALTSHTFRTSPTKRGKWILEVIFGTPPPPPPANAGVLKEDSDKKKAVKTFREQLARHAGQAACAACHKKMDPLGFALENFDAVGQWRDNSGRCAARHFRRTADGRKIPRRRGTEANLAAPQEPVRPQYDRADDDLRLGPRTRLLRRRRDSANHERA